MTEKFLNELVNQGLNKKVLDDYVNNGKITIFSRNGEVISEELQKEIKNYEEESGDKVYLATIENTSFGLLLDLFIISKYEEDNEIFFENLKEEFPYVYCLNLSNKMYSDPGNINIKIENGIIYRYL